MTLEEGWSDDPENLQVGDSVTRTITLVAEGIDGSQLPPLEQAAIPGLKTYPDQPQTENSRNQDGVTGIGINSAALLITEPGAYTLPAIRVPWWDTRDNRLRYATIPSRTLNIAPPAVTADAVATPAVSQQPTTELAAPATQATPVTIWLWTTIAALLGWLGTTVWLLWRLQRRPADSGPSTDRDATREAGLFRELAAACKENRPPVARRTLQHWGQLYFGDPALPTVSELKQRFANADLDQALSDLERCLYSSQDSSWQGGALLDALRAWRKQDSRDESRQAAALAPLYSSQVSA